MRLSRFWNLTPPTYAPGQPVEVLIAEETPLGYNAVIEHAHLGLLYRSELRENLTVGQRLDAYVRQVRPDGKIDLTLDQAGYERIQPLTQVILKALEMRGGRLPFHDNTSPEEIRAAFGVSKNAFKQAIGALFRQQLIYIEHQSIRLVNTKSGKG
jgi:predicted RNA-binding protein (virulence factor B family)